MCAKVNGREASATAVHVRNIVGWSLPSRSCMGRRSRGEQPFEIMPVVVCELDLTRFGADPLIT